jgi:dTMP kinase
MKGLFISFEGIEGSGKSTQSQQLADHFRKKGFSVVMTAEPGGTRISVQIRKLLLSTENMEMTPLTELLLYNAARVQHIGQVILPALDRGEIVITDRFSDSTTAYQGYGRGIDLKLIDSLDLLATGRRRPHLTILLDVDVETGLKRNRAVNKRDRLELEEISFHKRVRKGFISIAAKEPDRVKRIDCSRDIETVSRAVVDVADAFLDTFGA